MGRDFALSEAKRSLPMTCRNSLFCALLLSCCLVETAGADSYTVIATRGARLRKSPDGYTFQYMNLGDVVGGAKYQSTVDVVETDTIKGQTWSKLSDGRWINSHLLRDSSGKMPVLT